MRLGKQTARPRRLSIGAAALTLALMAQLPAAAGPATAPGTAVAAGGFVGTSGTAFVLGGAPFRPVGINLSNAAGDPAAFQCGGPWINKPDADVDAWFGHVRHDFGARVVRFWAFQSYTKGGTDWRGLDRVMRLANKYGLKVLPVLENQWTYCTEGGTKSGQWYAGGYLRPYGAYPLSYQDYVRRIVSRYKDEPAIFAWSLMNQAESKGADGKEDADALYDFTTEMSAFVKSLDPNHLVGLGTGGWGSPGTAGDDYDRLHEPATIDFLEAHDYGNDDKPLPGSDEVPISDLGGEVFTQDASWGWHDTEWHELHARVWETWNATVPAGSAPLQRLGLVMDGEFWGDLYVDRIQVGGRVYDFEDGTAEGWEAEDPINLVVSNVTKIAYSGSHALKLSRLTTAEGSLLWIEPDETVVAGTPVSVRLYVDTPGSLRWYNSLASNLIRAKRLGKPLLVGESGMDTCGPHGDAQPETPTSRAAKMNAKLRAFFDGGGAAYLVRGWDPRDDCYLNFTTGDPLNAVLARYGQ